MRILFAEDEADINKIVTRKLESDGYSVDSFFNGKDALDVLSYTDYDIVVLDIMMPGADGFEVLRAIRSSGKTTPVIFLTAKDSVDDKIKGLDSGANDYLVKPFSLEELSARIRALTRGSFQKTDNIITVGDLSLDTVSHAVKRSGKEITLSAKEYALLKYLMLNKGIVLSREKTLNSQSDRTTDPENEYKYVTDAASEKTTDKDTDTAVKTTSAATSSALSSASNSDTKIGVEKAKEIAVKQAGVEKGNVVFLKAKLEKENGRYVYEIEFHNRKTEYEFEIDAYTGEVVSYDKENADSDDCVSSTSANCNAIGLNNAKQIALKHAGLNSKDVVFSKAKLENDDGIQIYEIEMKKGKKEYEYKINAATGAIIECEIDY